MGTNIEWTDETDNIIVVEGGGWWCRKISEGSKNCYAAKLNQRPVPWSALRDDDLIMGNAQMRKIGKKSAGRCLDGQFHSEFPKP